MAASRRRGRGLGSADQPMRKVLDLIESGRASMKSARGGCKAVADKMMDAIGDFAEARGRLSEIQGRETQGWRNLHIDRTRAELSELEGRARFQIRACTRQR